MKHQRKERTTTQPGLRQRKTASTTRAILGRDREESRAPRLNPKWAWHYRVLLGLRERLLKDCSEQLAQSSEPLEPHSMDMADSATDEFDHDLALSRLSAEQHALYEVDDALNRIRIGTYGICVETGKAISAARLRAVPWTRFAKAAKARLEGKDAHSCPRLGALGSVRAALTGDLEESESEEAKQVPPPEDESLREVRAPAVPAKDHVAGPRREPHPRRRSKRSASLTKGSA
jgi:RNA polymerase-binding transcription factor DksA